MDRKEIQNFVLRTMHEVGAVWSEAEDNVAGHIADRWIEDADEQVATLRAAGVTARREMEWQHELIKQQQADNTGLCQEMALLRKQYRELADECSGWRREAENLTGARAERDQMFLQVANLIGIFEMVSTIDGKRGAEMLRRTLRGADPTVNAAGMVDTPGRFTSTVDGLSRRQLDPHRDTLRAVAEAIKEGTDDERLDGITDVVVDLMNFIRAALERAADR